MTDHRIPTPALDKVRLLVVGDVMLDRYWFGSFGSPPGDAVVLAVRRLDPIAWVEVHCHGGPTVVRWLTQLDGTRPDTEGESDDEFRLAGLFRPNEPAPGSSESRKAQSAKRRERRLFGLLEPIMRRRNRYQAVWRAALALGLRWCTLGMLISAGTFALLVVVMRRAVDEAAGDARGRWGSALGLSVTGILTIVESAPCTVDRESSAPFATGTVSLTRTRYVRRVASSRYSFGL